MGNPINRRKFLSQTITAGAATSLFSFPSLSLASGKGSPNDTVQIGIIGTGRMGCTHIRHIQTVEGVKIVALCDVDSRNLDQAQTEMKEDGSKVKRYSDLRLLLEDKDVDAVLIATPNHWHALAMIWACQAGKDVYIEKPVSHNIWEGTKMVEAARKYGRIVQAGTQNRSDLGFKAALEYLWEGKLGAAQWTHSLWYKIRKNHGPVSGPQSIPPEVDYDLWTGPSRLKPLERLRLHYDWHWDWDTGNGDMGNLGGHQMDDAIRIANIQGMPKRMLTIGGKYASIGDYHTPNTQAAILEFEDRAPAIVEIRGLPDKPGSSRMGHVRERRMGNIIECEQGYMAAGRYGGMVYDTQGERVDQFRGDGGLNHVANWLDAIRTRKHTTLNADIETSVRSATLCHVANIAYRCGRPTATEDIIQKVGGNDHFAKSIQSMADNAAANGADLSATPLTCSDWLSFDPVTETFSGADTQTLALADTLAGKPNYRAPFEVPDKV